jgi:hypothetical protein
VRGWTGNGTKETISMDSKHSTKIFEELMDRAGGVSWEQWCSERKALNLPLVDPVAPPKTVSGDHFPSSEMSHSRKYPDFYTENKLPKDTKSFREERQTSLRA